MVSPPHSHSPPAEHPSARKGSQATHASPLTPQVPTDRVSQVDPEQQPSGQVLALHPEHAPATQDSVTGQVMQSAPPTPQAVSAVPGMQVSPSQHPLHERESQMQRPPTQAWPGSQAGPPPHSHSPVREQLSARSGSQATQAAPPTPQKSTARA